MLLTIPVILGLVSIVADDSARNIYARIKSFFGNNKNLPDALGSWFFADSNPPGFYNVTKDVLLKTIEILHETSGWLTASNAERDLIFTNIANMVSQATQCDPAGVKKFCFWCFTAANGDASIYKYFSNPEAKYTVFDKISDAVSDTVSDVKESTIEMAEYAVKPSETTKAVFNPIVKYALIGLAGYIVIKKILK